MLIEDDNGEQEHEQEDEDGEKDGSDGPQEEEEGADGASGEVRVFSRVQAQARSSGPGQDLVSLDLPAGMDESQILLVADRFRAAVLLATPCLREVSVWVPPTPAFVGPLPAPAPIVELDFGTLVKVAGNVPELAVIRPLSLTLARTPALTLGKWIGRVNGVERVTGSLEVYFPQSSSIIFIPAVF